MLAAACLLFGKIKVHIRNSFGLSQFCLLLSKPAQIRDEDERI
jgi:hypothetical protein